MEERAGRGVQAEAWSRNACRQDEGRSCTAHETRCRESNEMQIERGAAADACILKIDPIDVRSAEKKR
jgi:hypothetical protein